MTEATEAGERTILTARRPELRKVMLGLVGAGVVCVVVDLAVWHSLTLVTLLGFLFWFAAAGLHVAPQETVVKASPATITIGLHDATPWSAVQSVVLTRREVLGPAGPEPLTYLVLAKSPITEFTPLAPVLQDDARVLLAHLLPPGAADLDADQLRTRLQAVHPDAAVVDHRR